MRESASPFYRLSLGNGLLRVRTGRVSRCAAIVKKEKAFPKERLEKTLGSRAYFSIASSSTSKMSVLFAPIFGLGLDGP